MRSCHCTHVYTSMCLWQLSSLLIWFHCVLQANKEAKEASKALKGKKNSELSLIAAIKGNREKRGDLLQYLEDKYGNDDADSSEDLVVERKTSKKRSKSQNKSATVSSKSKRQKRV